jgi:hypothetical protein
VQCEQAHPPGGVDRILVGMMTALGDLGRDIVDRDDAVEQHHNHENQQEKREIVQKRIAHERQPLRCPSQMAVERRTASMNILSHLLRGARRCVPDSAAY